MELRVHCFNLESGLVTIHDGKGQKDRTVPLPRRAMAAIRKQMEAVKVQLKSDLEECFAGTFLPKQWEKKYRNAGRELSWQLFPGEDAKIREAKSPLDLWDELP